MTLLEECIQVLKDNIYILSEEEKDHIDDIFFENILLTSC